jgi:glycosyltransferase involved in cell wall biosynthesis
VNPIETYFEEAFRTRSQGTTVISSALQKRAVALGVRPESIVQIPQGSDVENVKPLPRDACRKALGLPQLSPIVGYLGTLNRSDAELLYNTFICLSRSRSDCRLLMIGNHKSKPPSNPNILQTGYVTHYKLLQSLGACDLMLLPLKNTIASRGRWPSKINDYLAAGRPIVSTAVGDVSKLFEEYNIGDATQDRPEDLAQSAAELLSNESRLKEMGQNARCVAEEKFAWPILGDKLEHFYRKVLLR